MQYGANIHARNKGNEKTALILAIEHGKENVANFLIENGADASAKDLHGKDCLHYAIHSGLVTTVDKLLKYGADGKLFLKLMQSIKRNLYMCFF